MKVLFVTMVWPTKVNVSNMYTDLMSEFVEEHHNVTVLALNEARNGMPTALTHEDGMRILRVKCGNIQKTNKYKKVISSLLANVHIIHATRKYIGHENFDLLIFALPPATIAPAICKLKIMFKAKLYLLLKEFWPQDPADLGAMKRNGVVWKFFEFFSNKLYKSADYIGTMSQAGIKFLNSAVHCNIHGVIEACPNCLKNCTLEKRNENHRRELFQKYRIPDDKIICIFGGNLGISQGVPEMIRAIKSMSENNSFHFLIIGSGTEVRIIKNELENQHNVQLLDWIPAKEYDDIVKNSDIGMIFLYPGYSVPNIPSRFVGYLKFGLPVMASIDKATDLGKIIQENQCGYAIFNGDIEAFKEKLHLLSDQTTRHSMGEKARQLFEKEYTSKKCYEIINKHFL